MFQHSVRRFTGLAATLFIALVISTQDALAVVLPDPGTLDGTTSTVDPELDFLGLSWQGILTIVVAGIAVVVSAIIITQRHHRVARA